MPSAPAFPSAQQQRCWTNRKQAPNLLLRLKGQDETREMACSRHRGANSSGCDSCAKKFPVRKDVGSALETLGLNQHYEFKAFNAYRHQKQR